MRASLLLLAALVAAPALAGCLAPTPPAPATPAPPGSGPEPLLRFGERVTFPNSDFPAQAGTTCAEKDDGDLGCGLDEPSVVVDSQGRVYYTAACCIGVTSPVFVSEDGGATFRALEHPTKQGGGEGDVWVDAQGYLYYMDIDLATFGIARWSPDLAPEVYHRRTGIPLVDRPWIRATGDGNVFAIYNTGTDTVVYASQDLGTTFGLLPVASFGSGLAGAYSDSRRGLVGMYGAGAYMESLDHGATWGARTPVEGCTDGAPATYALEGAGADEAGTVWHLRHGCVVGRAADGAWGTPSRAIPEGFEVAYSWIAAGRAGGVAVVWYGQLADAGRLAEFGLAAADEWYVMAATSTDGGATWSVQPVDPDPVARGTRGDLGRRLGDFLQVAIGPDGAVHVAYSMNIEMDDSATASYRRSQPLAGLAPMQPLVGPLEGSEAALRQPTEEAKPRLPVA